MMPSRTNPLYYNIFVALFILFFTSCTSMNEPPEQYPTFDLSQKENHPTAIQKPYTHTKHGDERLDPYYWMREKDTPPVLDYLNAENGYTEAMLKPTEALQKELYSEITGKLKEDEASVPHYDNGYYYYSRYEAGSEYPIHCRKKTLDAPEEVLLHTPDMAKGHDYYRLSSYEVSPDNKMIAYSVDTVSRRQYAIHIKDTKGSVPYEFTIKNTTGTIVWAEDNQSIFYTIKNPETLRSYRIMRHVMGTEPSQDKVVFEEKDETFYTDIYKSKTNDYLIIGSFSTLSTEYRVLEADNPSGEFRVFHPREADHRYYITHADDGFYVVTNWQAKNFRVMKTSLKQTTKDHWQEYLPYDQSVTTTDIEEYADVMVIEERADGLIRFRVVDKQSGDSHIIDFGEETYWVSFGDNYDYGSSTLRYQYSSLTTPRSVIDYDLKARTRVVKKQSEVVGGHTPSDYQAERLYATARDGARVPISLVYKKRLKTGKPQPLLLYGYGSYGYTIDPYFSTARLSLLDRGFVFAIAHIRGSTTLGQEWYEDGKLLHKKNTFTDFIDCGEFLIEKGYTDIDHLFAQGGSAGGLLMGAVLNMKPSLFKGVIAEVPFVDVVTTMLDESIPLTTFEYDEWGNPNDKAYYDYMLSYSPYDNVVPQAYPHIYITTGYHDSQVQYWEPAKWAAKLRANKTDDNVLLFETDMSTGHSGASGRYKVYEEVARKYAFLLSCLGV